jgi:ATP-dependent Clp protease ATP-binding subunit ClpA
MEIENREIWVGTQKQTIGIKKFSHDELRNQLIKFPLEAFVYEKKYVAKIVNMCWKRDERFCNGINASYGDFLNVYKAILEVNPKLHFENYQLNLPTGNKKEIDKKNIARLESKREEIVKDISLEEIVSIVDFGELESYLNGNVIGQEEAIRQLLGTLINTKHMGTSEKECIVDYLLGPSGVGKTSSIKCLANYLSVPLLQIQGSEYEEEVASSKLFGGDPNYIGYDEKGGASSEVC